MTRAPIVAAIVALAGCHEDLADVDTIFYTGGTVPVHCALDLDRRSDTSIASIDTGLDRARDRGETIELYAHQPGTTVPVDTIAHVVAGAAARGLTFWTYDDVAQRRVSGPGLLLSFDDNDVDAWFSIRALLQTYSARVTFFVSRYDRMYDSQRAELRILANDGHAIEAHTIDHLHAPDYVERYGLDQYLAVEAQPSIDLLVADGYDVQAFAYPFGQRTDELDRALLARVAVLRSIEYAWEPVESPCPR